jgi:tetratricopeptide (TPR) repeat protein
MNGIWALFLILAMGLEGNPEYEHARELYNEFEYEQAVTVFKLLVKTPGRSATDKARLHTWVGLCYAQLGRNDEAQDAFDRATGYDPAVLAPPDSPPKVIQMLEISRQKVATPDALDKKAKRAKRRWRKKQKPPPDPHDADAASPQPTGEDAIYAEEDASSSNVQGAAAVDGTVSPGSTGQVPWLLIGAGTAGALGLVAMVGSIGFGSFALTDKGEADAAHFQNDAGEHLEDARTNALLSNVFLGTGVVLLGAGFGLWGATLMEGS